MVLFKKIRPRRGSLAVSIICGSPMAASSRSAAFAYRIGSPRHDSRYSAIDMSVSLRASKDRAKALNRESLYMIPLLLRPSGLLERDACTYYRSDPHVRPNQMTMRFEPSPPRCLHVGDQAGRVAK